MNFFSLQFVLVFLPLALLLFWVTPGRLKYVTIAVISVGFFAFYGRLNLILMISSVFFDYFMSSLVRYYRDKPRVMLLGVWLSVIKTLSLLGLFFALYFLNGDQLPLGLLVYCLSGTGYLVDLYRGDCEYERNFVRFLAYCSFFGRIFIGPFVKYATIRPQLRRYRPTPGALSTGISLVIYGLTKKLLVADELFRAYYKLSGLIQVDETFTTTLSAWVMLLSITLGTLLTLGAYCDIARGLGQMFSVKMPRNIHFPLSSTSITEYCENLSITLYQSLDHYLRPWGRHWRRHRVLDIVATLLITCMIGLWLLPSTRCLLFGLYLGVLLLLERTLLAKHLDRLPRLFQRLYTLALALFSFLILSVGSMAELKTLSLALIGIGKNGLWNFQIAYQLTSFWWALLVGLLLCLPLISRLGTLLHRKFPRMYALLVTVFNAVLLVVALGAML